MREPDLISDDVNAVAVGNDRAGAIPTAGEGIERAVCDVMRGRKGTGSKKECE